MSRRNLLLRFSLVSLLLLMAPALFAQQTGSVTGTVTTDGQPLPGVTVEARSSVLPQPRITVTAANGDYRWPQLPPGRYSIVFSLAGMQTVTRGVNVNLNQDSVVTVALGVETLAETITVTADSPLIDQTSTEIKSSVS